MMTIAQARKLVGRQIGLPESFDGSVSAYANLTVAQQLELTKKLLDFIVNNPGNFTPAQVETATRQQGQAATFKTEDTSLGAELGAFWGAFEAQAIQTIGEPLKAIGDGVSSSVSLVGKILPFALLAAAVIFALPYVKKAAK